MNTKVALSLLIALNDSLKGDDRRLALILSTTGNFYIYTIVFIPWFIYALVPKLEDRLEDQPGWLDPVALILTTLLAGPSFPAILTYVHFGYTSAAIHGLSLTIAIILSLFAALALYGDLTVLWDIRKKRKRRRTARSAAGAVTARTDNRQSRES